MSGQRKGGKEAESVAECYFCGSKGKPNVNFSTCPIFTKTSNKECLNVVATTEPMVLSSLLRDIGIRLEKPSRPRSTTLPWSCVKCARKSFHIYKPFIELTDAVSSKTEKRQCLSPTNSSGLTPEKKRHQPEPAGLVSEEEQELEETLLEPSASSALPARRNLFGSWNEDAGEQTAAELGIYLCTGRTCVITLLPNTRIATFQYQLRIYFHA